MKRALGFTALFLGMSACSMKCGNAVPADTTSDAGAAFCSAMSKRSAGCPRGAAFTSAELTQCERLAGCHASGILRDGAGNAIEQCMLTQQCGDTDSCVTPSIEQYSSEPQVQTVGLACQSKSDICSSQGSPIAVEFCTQIPILSDDARAAADSCLNMPCVDVEGCLEDLWSSYHCR